MASNNPNYRQIIRLARSGALERAWARFEASGLAGNEEDPRALTLRARLKKDRAKRSEGAERIDWLRQSAADYLAAAAISGGSYPMINAASLSLLAGQPSQAARLAQQVLDLLEARPEEAETRYWHGATRAEAFLLLGKLPEARAALRTAVADAPLAWEDRAATLGQFQLVCAELGHDSSWLDQLRPPRSVHFSGIMGVEAGNGPLESEIADWLERENVGFGFGALAAGADIWIAEALDRRGAELHVILPCPADIFRTSSVCAVDPVWGERFDRLMERAVSVDVLDTANSPTPAAVKLGDAVARGLAIHNARNLQSEALALRIDGLDDPVRDRGGDGSSLRQRSFTVARRSGGPDFRIDESGVSQALLRIGGEKETRMFASAGEAWSASAPARREGLPVVLDYQFRDPGEPQAEVTAKLDALAEVVEPGQALATKAMSFALLAEEPGLHVDMLGDVRTAGGFMPLYALA